MGFKLQVAQHRQQHEEQLLRCLQERDSAVAAARTCQDEEVIRMRSDAEALRKGLVSASAKALIGWRLTDLSLEDNSLLYSDACSGSPEVYVFNSVMM